MDEREFLNVCARVLRVPAETLSLATARDGLQAWDSIAHLRLVMETESAFGGEIPLARIPDIRTLGELRDALGELSNGKSDSRGGTEPRRMSGVK